MGLADAMKYLILAPPVITPSEPPSGAFLLTAGLNARGIEAAFLDLSILFFKRVIGSMEEGRGMPSTSKAVDYMKHSAHGYEPHRHRTFSGMLNSAMQRYSERFPGWRITLMDALPPCDQHSPQELNELFSSGGTTPFAGLWEEELLPILDDMRPETVLISLSYLSQLPAAIDLNRFLTLRGITPVVGGSLPRSLKHSGSGMDLLGSIFARLDTGDGSSLEDMQQPFLEELVWPLSLSGWDNYLTCRPVIPFALSSGCYWDGCLFCPDRGAGFRKVSPKTLHRFIESIPPEVLNRKPVLHFLDSAIPPAWLRELPAVLAGSGARWYGFVRPTGVLVSEESIMESLASSGCLMLQMGLESGSRRLLDLFGKNIDPQKAISVVRAAADAGIRTYCYLLFGLPGETTEDRRLTSEMLSSADQSIDYLNLSVFNLPRNCELAERADEFGMEVGEFPAPGHTIRLYSPFTTGESDPRSEARDFIRKELTDIPAVSQALSRTPRWFRTSHLAMMDLPGRKGL